MDLIYKPQKRFDYDGDYVVNAFDSDPKNPLRQSNPVMQTTTATIPTTLKPQLPKKPVKPPTIAERERRIQPRAVQIPKELTPEEIEQYQKEFIEENIQKSVETIDKEIERQNQRVENVKHRLNVAIREGNQSKISNLREVLDRTVDESGRQIQRLTEAKPLAQTGQYTPSSLIQYAGSQVAQTLKRVEYKQQARITYQKQIQQWKKEVAKELKRQDMTPVFDKQGNLRGVRDTQTGMSIPIQELKDYLVEPQSIVRETKPSFQDITRPRETVLTPYLEKTQRKLSKLPEPSPKVFEPYKETSFIKIPFSKKLSDLGKKYGQKFLEGIEKPRRVIEEKLFDQPTTGIQIDDKVPVVVQPDTSSVFRRETLTYKPPTFTPTQTAESELAVEYEKAAIQTEDLRNKITEKIQDKFSKEINKLTATGMVLSPKDIQLIENKYSKQAQQEFEREFEKIEQKYTKEFEKIDKKRLVELAKQEQTDIPGTVARSALSFGLYTIPYYGQALLYKDIGTMAVQPVKTAKSIVKKPVESAVTIGTFAALGGVTAGIKRTRTQAKISEAIKQSDIKFRSRGIIRESEIYKFKKDVKTELQKFIDDGFSLRESEVILKPRKGFEEWTPRVSGKVIEIIDAQGKVAQRISIGKLSAELKGKKIEASLKEEAIRYIEEGGKIREYSELLTIEKRQPMFGMGDYIFPRSKKTYERFYMEIEPTGFKKGVLKGKKAREVRTEFLKRRLGEEKFKGKKPSKIFEKPFDLVELEKLKKTGKPYTKGEAVELQLLEGTRAVVTGLEVKGKVAGFLLGERFYKAGGYGVSKFIKEKPKPKIRKPKKEPFKLPGFAFFKKSEKPKVEKFKEDAPATLVAPDYVTGGQVGVKGKSIYEGTGLFTPSDIVTPFLEKATPRLVGEPIFFGIGKQTPRTLGELGVSTETEVTPVERTKVKTKVKPVSVLRIETRLDKELKLKTKPSSILDTAILQKENILIKDYQTSIVDSKLDQGLRQLQLTKLKQRQVTKLEQKPVTVSPPPITPPSKTPIRFTFVPTLFPEEVYKKETQTGYQTYVKEKGKFIKVSDKPMTRKGAKSLGARYVDNTTAATFKIEPIKQTKTVGGKKITEIKVFNKNELERGNGYFSKIKNKLRGTMIRKGKPVLMEDQWIERKKKRADTSGEQRGLSIAKYKAELEKQTRGVPIRKSRKRRRGNVKNFFGIG